MKRILVAVGSFLATLTSIVGIFLMVVGVVNGFGNPALTSHITVTLTGLVLSLASLYTLYLVNDKDLEKIVDSLFLGINK